MEKNKVTIEITSTGFTTTLFLNGKEYKEVHISEDDYSCGLIEGDFEEEENIPDCLFDSLSGLSQFDILMALKKVEKNLDIEK